jgi:superfamily II DNA/RNA helicase
VYFVHNRVESIFSIGNLLQRLVPEARIVVGHGQMGEDELERAMLGFVERRFDILLATTIVENGLDIPNANTIIINRADRFGLAQLYQLRGRVGRSHRHAYAYLLIPGEQAITPDAEKRLRALQEIDGLGGEHLQRILACSASENLATGLGDEFHHRFADALLVVDQKDARVVGRKQRGRRVQARAEIGHCHAPPQASLTRCRPQSWPGAAAVP